MSLFGEVSAALGGLAPIVLLLPLGVVATVLLCRVSKRYIVKLCEGLLLYALGVRKGKAPQPSEYMPL